MVSKVTMYIIVNIVMVNVFSWARMVTWCCGVIIVTVWTAE